MKRIAFSSLLVAALASMTAVYAQDLKGQPIKEVKIQGLARVSEQQVRSKLEVQAGQPYAAPAVSRDIRRLYDLGFFSSIKVDAAPAADGVTLTYVVEEKRLIDEIRIVGNDKMRERNIRGALKWREGDSFVADAYNDEREAILKLYESKGFPNASVDIVVEETGPSRVRVTYYINEQKKARISHIRFVGNDTISSRKLRKSMKTKHAWWFMGGKYDEATFEDDLKKILDEYGNYGRLEAEIAKTDFVYSEDGKHVEVTVHVAEGPEYHLAGAETAGNTVYDDDEVMNLLKVRAGDVHDKGQVDKDAELVQKGYRDSGYVNAKVTPQVTLDKENKTTHVVQRVEEGDLRYVKEVDITGNSVTRDDVIRREIMLHPGERFDGGAVEMSQRRLEDLEYFDNVRFTLDDVQDSDRYSNLLVDVEEGKTGFFNFGGGYSTEDKFGGFTELRFTNFDITNWPTFSGGGQFLRARLSLGERRNEYYLSFTDPEIAGYPLAFGADIFDESYEYEGGIDYTEKTRGAQLRLMKVLSPFVTARTALEFRDTDVEDLPYYASADMRDERGGSTTISTIWGINRNTEDSRRDTNSGAVHDFQVQLAGLGGDNNFYKIEQDSTWFWPLDSEKKWILSARTRQGWVNEYGSSEFVPITDRFFAGGTSTVRGYDQRDIGPTERRFIWFGEKDRVGGDLRLVNNIELKYKVTKQLRLYAFVDSGGVWRSADDFDFGDVKYGAGIGMGVDIPKMGPIRVDYGIPLNPDEDQGSGRLHLMTGLRF